MEMINKSTGLADGVGAAVTGTIQRISGGTIVGRIEIKQDDGIVEGVRLICGGGTHAITVMANRVVVMGCVVDLSSTYKAIMESSGYNHNLFMGNIVNRAISVSGAQSLAVNNIDSRVTA